MTTSTDRADARGVSAPSLLPLAQIARRSRRPMDNCQPVDSASRASRQCADEWRFDDVLAHEPRLGLVRAHDLADDEVGGAVVAELGRLTGDATCRDQD